MQPAVLENNFRGHLVSEQFQKILDGLSTRELFILDDTGHDLYEKNILFPHS